MIVRSIKFLRPVLALVAVAMLSVTAFAQNPKLRLDSLVRLGAKASKTVEVTVDRELMAMAVKFLSGETDADTKKVRELVAGIQEIFVRGFEFENEGEYNQADVDEIRSQLSGPGWSRITGVRSKKGGENAEIYVMHGGGKVLGLTILATDPKEVTIVNIIGEIDPARLSELEGELGVPRMELKREVKTAPAPTAKTSGRSEDYHEAGQRLVFHRACVGAARTGQRGARRRCGVRRGRPAHRVYLQRTTKRSRRNVARPVGREAGPSEGRKELPDRDVREPLRSADGSGTRGDPA